MSAVRVRGEWEAERCRGRGIVACSNGGFPPPVSQAPHVTRPKEVGPRIQRKVREGGGCGGLGRQVHQSDFVFSSMIFLTALQQFSRKKVNGSAPPRVYSCFVFLQIFYIAYSLVSSTKKSYDKVRILPNNI